MVVVKNRPGEGQHHPRVRPEVRDLPRVRLAGDQDGLAVPAEPDRDEVGQPVGSDRAQPDDRLGIEQARHACGGSGIGG
jgi:hypothetical protein